MRLSSRLSSAGSRIGTRVRRGAVRGADHTYRPRRHRIAGFAKPQRRPERVPACMTGRMDAERPRARRGYWSGAQERGGSTHRHSQTSAAGSRIENPNEIACMTTATVQR